MYKICSEKERLESNMKKYIKAKELLESNANKKEKNQSTPLGNYP